MKRHHIRINFTPEEDARLISLVQMFGTDFRTVSSLMLNRSARQCRDRYFTYLSPSVNRTEWTQEEDDLLLNFVNMFGRKWVSIAKMMPGRTDTNIKNRWNLLMRRMSLNENHTSHLDKFEKNDSEAEAITNKVKLSESKAITFESILDSIDFASYNLEDFESFIQKSCL